MKTGITSVGYYLPDTSVSTSNILAETNPQRFGLANDFLEKSIGVEKVRYCDNEVKPSDLAAISAEKALAKININKDHIDLIIYCGIEGDFVEPSTAHVVQRKLGLKSEHCFDVQNACLGFMSGLKIASTMISAGEARYALVCTGEKGKKLANSALNALKQTDDKFEYYNKLGYLTVGDAGGAVVVGPSGDEGIHNFDFASIGHHASLCYYKNMPNGGFEGQMLMGKIVSAVKNEHAKIYQKSMDNIGWTSDQIDCLITHQVGDKPFALYSQVFKVPFQRMTKTYNYLGNITTATFPVNLGKAVEEKIITQGKKIFAAMSGSGISICHSAMTL